MILDRTIAPKAPTKTPEPAAPAAPTRLLGLSVADAARLMWRGRLTILGCALAGAIGAGLLGKALPSRFNATAQLYIDPRDLRIVENELNPREGDSNSVIAQIESEARIVVGTNVLRRVIESQRLADDPDFQDKPSLFARLGLGGAIAPTEADGTTPSGPMQALARKLNVRRVERTFIVDVTATAPSAEKSAKLANAVAEAYLAEAGETRSSAARRATGALQARLAELGERVRQAENRVEEYKARNRLVGSRVQLVTEQQLTDVNTQLTAARGRVADAQARYEQVQDAVRRLRDTGSIPEAVASQTIGALRAQYAQLRARQAELRDLGPRHPALLNQAAQVADVQRLIAEEIGRIAQAAKNDLDRAKALEVSVAATLDGLKRQTLEDGGASVRLRELEREAEAGRAIYQAFLNRSREISEQERLDTANARIVTVALPPDSRSFPPRVSLLVLLGGAGGLALGAYLALAPALLAGAPPRNAPGDAPGTSPSDAPGIPPARRPAPASAPGDPTGGHAVVRAPFVRLGPSARLPVLAALDETTTAIRPARRGRTVSLAELGLPALEPAFRPVFAEALRAGLGLRADLDFAEAEIAAGPPRIAVLGPDAAARTAVAVNLALALGPVLLVDADAPARGLSRAASRSLRAPARQGALPSEDTFRLTDEGTVLLEAPARAAPGAPGQAELARAYAGSRPDLAAVVLDGPGAGPGHHAVDHVVLAATGADLAGDLRGWLRRQALPGPVAGIVAVTAPLPTFGEPVPA